MPTTLNRLPMKEEEFIFLLWLIKLRSCEPMKFDEEQTDERIGIEK